VNVSALASALRHTLPRFRERHAFADPGVISRGRRDERRTSATARTARAAGRASVATISNVVANVLPPALTSTPTHLDALTEAVTSVAQRRQVFLALPRSTVIASVDPDGEEDQKQGPQDP
jgi:hypothetical protein